MSWFKKLIGGDRREEQGREAPPRPRVPQGPRKMTTLDVPMVMARLRVLGVLDRLDARYHADLERAVKECCREGRVRQWWGPLRSYHERRAREATDWFQPVSARHRRADRLVRALLDLGELLRLHRFELTGVTGADGEPLVGEDPVPDGELRLNWSTGEASGAFPVHVREGELDLPGLLAEINAFFAERDWPERLFLLPREGDAWGVVACPEPVARKAAGSGWGELPGG